MPDRISKGKVSTEDIVDRCGAVGGGKSQGNSRVRLWIKIDEKYPTASGGKNCRKIDSSRGLSATPFLIGDRNNTHTRAPPL